MELERSRNGYYTLTFFNKKNLTGREIYKVFSSAGNVCQVLFKHRRVFLRFKNKDEAERALLTYGESFELTVATNKGENLLNGTNSDLNQEDNRKSPLLPTPLGPQPAQTMDKLTSGFHLILGNLPKNYTVKDVQSLVEEAKPLSINTLDETRALHIKFCHVVLETLENLSYLINKLDGFVICGEKLIAVEAKRLLEWKHLNV